MGHNLLYDRPNGRADLSLPIVASGAAAIRESGRAVVVTAKFRHPNSLAQDWPRQLHQKNKTPRFSS
jgi:hypothetical protein